MGFDRGLMEPESASHQGRGALVHKKNRFPPRARSRFTEPVFFIYIYIYIEIHTDIHMLPCMLLLTYVYICVYTIERKQSEVVLVLKARLAKVAIYELFRVRV